MAEIQRSYNLESKGSYDVIVAGGGVAGVAAALTANQRGLKVLLIEKSCVLGGLATMGLVNLFVPMCNGRGRQIIFGLADKWIDECVEYGYETMVDEWKNRKDGFPSGETKARLVQRYSPYIFALQMTEMIKNAGVDLLFDCIVTEPVMDGNVCKGLITESKSGKYYFEAKMVIDTTGDADILRRSGMPTVKGKNFHTYIGKLISLDSCQKAIEKHNIDMAFTAICGGGINLYGHNQPADVPMWSGTTVEEVTDYYIFEQLEMLKNVKAIKDKNARDIAMLPMMPNFRTTCRIDGDYTLQESDAYKHFDDSICAINDFERRDFLYEVPLRCLTRKGWPNLITAGRCAAGEGYAWDVLRVIPPAIITGQAAAEAAALAIESSKPIAEVDISVLQARLENDDNIMIHFPDELIPEDTSVIEIAPACGHV